LRLKVAVVVAALMLALVECAKAPPPLPSPIAVPAGEATPRVLSDLSSLGAADPTDPFGRNAHNAVPSPPPAPAPVAQAPHSRDSETRSNLGRLFLEKPGAGKVVGTAAAPGEERLLNDKASRFAPFSRTLLHQLFVAAQDLEKKEIENKVLSINLLPVIVTATMSKEGKLTELLLEQHSGSGAVDQLVVKACEQGLWASNPPPDAIAADGNYHFRIEAVIKNFNRTTQANVWNFETDLALGLD